MSEVTRRDALKLIMATGAAALLNGGGAYHVSDVRVGVGISF